MRTLCEIPFAINGKNILLRFNYIESPLPETYVQFPVFDNERIMMNKLMIARYKEMGLPESEIPNEPFPLGYSISDLKNDLAVISLTKAINTEESDKLIFSLLETIINWHVNKFGRLLRNDLETYVTICLCLTCAVKYEQICTFDSKKALYDKATLYIREKFFEIYKHTDLIQI